MTSLSIPSLNEQIEELRTALAAMQAERAAERSGLERRIRRVIQRRARYLRDSAAEELRRKDKAEMLRGEMVA